MKKLILILICLLVTTQLAQDVYEFLVTNEGLKFYSRQPRWIIFVMGVGFVGGLVALIFSKMSCKSRRLIKLASLACFALGAAVASLFTLWMIYTFLNPPFIFTINEIQAFGLLLFFCAVLAGIIWMEFRAERKKFSERNPR